MLPVFLTSTLFGDDAIVDEEMIDSFKNYVALEEKDTITAMLNNFKEEDEDILDVLSAYNCKSKPNC